MVKQRYTPRQLQYLETVKRAQITERPVFLAFFVLLGITFAVFGGN